MYVKDCTPSGSQFLLIVNLNKLRSCDHRLYATGAPVTIPPCCSAFFPNPPRPASKSVLYSSRTCQSRTTLKHYSNKTAVKFETGHMYEISCKVVIMLDHSRNILQTIPARF